jgi:hypothetical protein
LPTALPTVLPIALPVLTMLPEVTVSFEPVFAWAFIASKLLVPLQGLLEAFWDVGLLPPSVEELAPEGELLGVFFDDGSNDDTPDEPVGLDSDFGLDSDLDSGLDSDFGLDSDLDSDLDFDSDDELDFLLLLLETDDMGESPFRCMDNGYIVQPLTVGDLSTIHATLGNSGNEEILACKCPSLGLPVL